MVRCARAVFPHDVGGSSRPTSCTSNFMWPSGLAQRSARLRLRAVQTIANSCCRSTLATTCCSNGGCASTATRPLVTLKMRQLTSRVMNAYHSWCRSRRFARSALLGRTHTPVTHRAIMTSTRVCSIATRSTRARSRSWQVQLSGEARRIRNALPAIGQPNWGRLPTVYNTQDRAWKRKCYMEVSSTVRKLNCIADARRTG